MMMLLLSSVAASALGSAGTPAGNPLADVFPTALVNPGAETGDLTGWTGDVVVEDVNQYSGIFNGAVPRTGSWFFYGGDNVATSSMYQDIAIHPDDVGFVDLGILTIELDWWQGSFNGDDGTEVTAHFYDVDEVLISSAANGLVQAPSGAWHGYTLTAAIPVDTRLIRVEFDMIRGEGFGNNNTYVDDILARYVRTDAVATDRATTYSILGTPINRLNTRRATPYAVMGGRADGAGVRYQRTFVILE